ncbi:MAG: universal stress protein [Flavobacteriaceae bacterium]|nr:universal stress protein [Flavobacteriaceae bacterium]
MRKKLLIPTDFSKNAWVALSYAIELFRNEVCDFYVLNVFDTVGFELESLLESNPDKSVFEIAQEQSELGLKKISQRVSFRDEALDHNYFYLSQNNDLLNAIKDVVEKKDIELIVMGTKGHTDSNAIIFGSNAVTVMEKARNCPVLCIPPNVIYSDPKEIVFPTSFRTHFKRRELEYLIEIARLTNAPIRVLHVAKEGETLDEEQENYKQLLEEYFDGLEYSFHTIYNADVQTALNVFVQSRDSGMITFFNKKHTFFSNLLTKPMVKELGYHSKIPVLALHDFRN